MSEDVVKNSDVPGVIVGLAPIPPEWRCDKHGEHLSTMIVTTEIGTANELETVYCMHCLREVLDAKIGRMTRVR